MSLYWLVFLSCFWCVSGALPMLSAQRPGTTDWSLPVVTARYEIPPVVRSMTRRAQDTVPYHTRRPDCGRPFRGIDLASIGIEVLIPARLTSRTSGSVCGS